MVSDTVVIAVAAVCNIAFWGVAIRLTILIWKKRHKILRDCHCGIRIAPRNRTRSIVPKHNRFVNRTDSRAPVINEWDSESTIGDDSDEWDDYSDEERREQDGRIYMNQLQAHASSPTGGKFESYNSLRSENLQLDLFNRAFGKGSSANPRESQSYETMPDDLAPPGKRPSVIYQRGQEIVKINPGKPLQSDYPQFQSGVAYENFDAAPPPPKSPPPPLDRGAAPPPPTTPPPPLDHTSYENIPEGAVVPPPRNERPKSSGEDKAVMYEDLDAYQADDPRSKALDWNPRPQSFNYENPDYVDGPPIPRRLSTGSTERGHSIAYEDPTDYSENTLKKARDKARRLSQSSAGGRGHSIAYEDPTDYSEATLRKARQKTHESQVYEELADEPLRRRDTMSAEL